jgi:hypothetical protein
MDYNICPYFVKVLGGNINIPLKNIWSYLLENRGIEKNNFLRNIIIMRFTQLFNILGKKYSSEYLKVQDRPSINDDIDNTNVKLSGNPRIVEGTNISGGDIRYKYNVNYILEYNIPTNDELLNIKSGYILTEESNNPTFEEILCFVKIVDIIYDEIKKLKDDLINDNLSNKELNLYWSNIDRILESIPNKNYEIQSSKIFNKMKDLFQDIDVYLKKLPDISYKRKLNQKINKLLSFSSNQNGNDIIQKAIFQILIACYSLFLSGVAHNDLHAKNIFLEIMDEPETINYIINNELYQINTLCKPKIYDFDRSYIKNHNNNILNNNIISQNNELVNNKDFVKILCYINKYNINEQINNYISLIVIKGVRIDEKRLFLNAFYDQDDSCFLRQVKADKSFIGSDSSFYTNFYDYETLIKIFGSLMKQNIDDHNINNEQKYYYLNKNYFKNNEIINLEEIEKDILNIGNKMNSIENFI